MPTPLLKIAAAYIRVSDERQDEYSPDSQLKIARERAAKEGYQIPDEYVFYDDGISGKNARRRNEFRRMIAIAKEKEHPFDAIYVWKFSRFARNQEESIVYKNLLAKKGVSVVSVSEPIPEGPFGKLIERIIEWMDEYYLINLSTEVKRGMTEKASRGEPLGPPPFGYRMQDGCYYPDGEKADIIREIFDRFNSGEGMRTIARDLSARGIRTIRGNPTDNRWVDYVLADILSKIACKHTDSLFVILVAKYHFPETSRCQHADLVSLMPIECLVLVKSDTSIRLVCNPDS